MQASLPDQRHFVFVMEQALGHVVHTMNIERVLASRPDLDGTVIRVDPSESRLRGVPLGDNWTVKASWATRDALRRHRAAERPIDGVFVHTQAAALMTRSLMRTVPTVVSMDATPVNFDSVGEAYGHRRGPELVERAKLVLTRRALTAADAIVTWSRWAADSAVADYGVLPDRVHVIPPGVDIHRFRPAGAHRDGPLRILFVGGDFLRKGGGDLVDAVRRMDRPVQLDVVSATAGAPDDPRIRLHGGVDNGSTDLLELYRRADVFALPTHGDCNSIAISEAFASGLPVVATAVGGVRELVDDGRNGFVVPPQDPDAIARALTALADDPQLRVAMGARGRILAETELDADANCRRIFDLLGTVADRRQVDPVAPSGRS